MEPSMRANGNRVAPDRYHLFGTAIGVCGLAWSAEGLTRFQLPERDAAATEARLRACAAVASTGPMPAMVIRAITALQRYLAGRRTEFSDLDLDFGRASRFHREAYEIARRIGWGETRTYGSIACEAGVPGAARAVGQAMAGNPLPIIVPCHRVLAEGRKLGGFSAFGGTVTKQRLLALEGVSLADPASALPPLS
jgi:methylated-DNA-[protein]-cysteine S-methyltransferase